MGTAQAALQPQLLAAVGPGETGGLEALEGADEAVSEFMQSLKTLDPLQSQGLH
jgi:hypothetical protein